MECAYDYVRLRRTRGFWTALTLLTALTVLTADKIDEVDPIGLGRQQRQCGQFCPPSMQSILSTPSMMSKTWPPPSGLAATAHRVTIALTPSDDFGEIIDTGRCILLSS